jgi:tetratricopeptide (TPR) repeat protein
MLKPDHEDHAEEAGLQELIEQFESYLINKEYAYFDEEALERLYEFYEIRLDETRMESVADLAISNNPYSSDFLVRKAEILFNRKQYREALDLLDKAVVFDATNMDIYLLRSDVLVESNRPQEAIELLKHALSLVDQDEKDVVLAELSDVYEMQEDFHAAFNCLAEALSFNPQSEMVLMKFAHLVDMTDRYEESLNIHQGITDEHPYKLAGMV